MSAQRGRPIRCGDGRGPRPLRRTARLAGAVSQEPFVCFDEKPIVLHAPTRPSRPPRPGHPARLDYAYERAGGHRHCLPPRRSPPGLAPCREHRASTERRTHTEYAQCLRWLVDEAFPEAPRIRIVQDHLCTHDPSSLYAPCPPEEAHRIRQRLEFHYTPVHGSWLNRAEIAIGIFERGCLSRPLEGLVDLCQRAAAWEGERNAQRRMIHWQFTTPDARQKLARLYPNVKSQLD